MFRDARHYFTKVSRHIESYDEIAKLIGEQIYYTDDDLFSIACALSLQKFNCRIPSQLSGKEKINLATQATSFGNKKSIIVPKITKVYTYGNRNRVFAPVCWKKAIFVELDINEIRL